MLHRFFAISITILLVAGVAPLSAHHSSAPHFDRDTEIVLNGVVTSLRFVNPHAYVFFDAAGDDGETAEWRCELSAATALQRRGWTPDTLSPGDRITISGAPARREDNVCFLNSFTTEGGVQITRGGDLIELGVSDEPEFVVYTSLAEGRPRYLDSGQPNISGDWVRFRGEGMGGGAAPEATAGLTEFLSQPIEIGEEGLPTGPENNAAGLAVAENWDYRFDNPALFCKNANIIHGWQHDGHVNRIEQSDDEITLKYGYNDLVRTIHLNETGHPEDIVPSTEGHSIGWWDGDTLVVDTIGFSPNVMSPIQEIMHSDQMHIVEQFRLDYESERLTRSYIVEDAYFVSPYARQDVMAPSAHPNEPYDCVELAGENNARPEQ